MSDNGQRLQFWISGNQMSVDLPFSKSPWHTVRSIAPRALQSFCADLANSSWRPGAPRFPPRWSERNDSLPLVRSGNPGQASPHLLLRLLRRPMAATHQSRLPSRPGLRTRPRHLCALPGRHPHHLPCTQTCARYRSRGRSLPLRSRHHPSPQVTLGRRPHPSRGRGRRTVRPREPSHSLPALPPRSHRGAAPQISSICAAEHRCHQLVDSG